MTPSIEFIQTHTKTSEFEKAVNTSLRSVLPVVMLWVLRLEMLLSKPHVVDPRSRIMPL